jgi:hypothetical protein
MKLSPHVARVLSSFRLPSSLNTRTSSSTCSIQPPGVRALDGVVVRYYCSIGRGSVDMGLTRSTACIVDPIPRV